MTPARSFHTTSRFSAGRFSKMSAILEDAGSSWDRIFDVTVFLTNMKDDFAAYNRVYAEYFADNHALPDDGRSDLLPTPIAIEFKVIATIYLT